MLYGSDSAIFHDILVLCFFWRLVTYDLKKRVRLFLGFRVFLGSSLRPTWRSLYKRPEHSPFSGIAKAAYGLVNPQSLLRGSMV